MAKKKKPDIPILRVPKNATMRQIYKAARESFTAADLQKYTEIEEGIPMKDVLAAMEKIQRKADQKKKKV